MAGGRPKKPTLQKIAEGNPGGRALEPEREVKPDLGIPDPPDFLDAEAKKEWERVTPYLYKAGLLAHIDRAGIAAYCQSWSRWVAAEMAMKGQPMVGKTPTGRFLRNPNLGIAHTEMNHVWKCLSAFGMTPSSRAGLFVDAPSEHSTDLWKKFAEMSRAKKTGTTDK